MCLWWAYRWWYEPILPLESSFPSACRRTLTRLILSVSSHLSRKRPADIFLEFLTNASAIVIVFLSELSGALMDGGSPALSPVEAVELYLQENPESNLANMLDTEQQQKKLVTVANDLLHDFLDSRSYDCEAVRVFLREILAKVVLEMTVQSCSKPDWITDLILYLLEQGEPELMNAIDAGVGGATANGNQKAISETSLTGAFKDALMPSGYAMADGQNEQAESNRTKDPIEEAKRESKDLGTIPVDASERGQGQRASDLLKPRADTESLEPPVSPQRSRSLGDGHTWTAHDAGLLPSASSMSGAQPGSTFTSFDQIVPSHVPTALTSTIAPGNEAVSLRPTLQGARISILDDYGPDGNVLVRAKPTADYILQIEQASSQQPGWMITRKYVDFENLHEILRRISVISGLVNFTEQHSALPGWKGKRKSSLREELERYLSDALIYNRLAESEGMKRFLSKDQGLGSSSSSASGNLGFGFPSPATFETMGRGMIDALSNAPKGAAVGGKSLLGGVTGVLSGVGPKGQRKATSNKLASAESPHGIHQAESTSSSGGHDKYVPDSTTSSVMDSVRSHEIDSPNTSPHLSATKDNPLQIGHSQSKRPPDPRQRRTDENILADYDQDPSRSPTPRKSLSSDHEELHLPPPPSDIPDDYGSSIEPSRLSISSNDRSAVQSSTITFPTSAECTSQAATSSPLKVPDAGANASTVCSLSQTHTAITEDETQITVELVFAVINELYTLSSAWNIRRTLLSAARTYLLRPGNPNLEAIRSSVQNSVIDPYTSDSGVAALVEKGRENALPTDEERKAWPQPPSDEIKETRRMKARKILVERGMPQALMAIMGAAASSEALGRVFDCLQSDKVARGLVFHLLLQAIKAVMQ